MSGIELVLSRLDRVKQSGEGRWVACCPSHNDHNPSLSIKETEDRRLLIHCFAGCVPAEILAAVGLELSDLFDPDKIPRNTPIGPSREAFEWANLIFLVDDYDRKNGLTHSDEDRSAITKAQAIFDQVPKPPKPDGKPKLAPFSRSLAERQRYLNLPFLVLICVGTDCWSRAKRWIESPNDILGLVLPDAWPECYTWPVKRCNVIVERDIGPSNELIIDLCKILFKSGANAVVVQTLGIGVERIYYGGSYDAFSG